MDLGSFGSLNIIESIQSAIIPNEMCRNDTNKVLKGIWQTKPWALRMADSIGKIPSGFLEGNVLNIGSMDECLAAREDEDDGTFTGKYCLVKFLIPLQKKNLEAKVTYQWGTCLPSSCTAWDIKTALSNVLNLDSETDELYCQTREARPYETQELVTIGILCFLTLWTIISTIYDYSTSSGDRNKYLLTFSLKKNVRDLLETKTTHGSLTCLDGMRVITMFFVIMAHVYLSEAVAMASVNMTRVLEWFSDWTHVWLTSRALSVDIFFVFSGALVSFSFMNRQSKGKKFNLLLHYIHRYLRVTPALAITLLLNSTLFSRIGSGPLWKPYSHNTEQDCRNNWWKYLLFINNWFPFQKCMIHVWYIAVDSQLYFLSPILLIPLHRWPRFGLGLAFAALITAFFISFGISYFKEEHVDIYRHYTAELNIGMHGTYHRSTPWLIGFILGYFLQKHQHISSPRKHEEIRNRKMTWRKALLMALISVTCAGLFFTPMLAVHPFIQPDYQYNALESAAYLSLSHVIFALSVVLIILSCLTGYGGFFNLMFSWKAFVPLSRLNYSTYLIHMIVVQSYAGSVRTPGYLNDYDKIMTTCSITIVTLVLSVILYLLVEQPAVRLERLLLSKKYEETPALPMSHERDG